MFFSFALNVNNNWRQFKTLFSKVFILANLMKNLLKLAISLLKPFSIKTPRSFCHPVGYPLSLSCQLPVLLCCPHSFLFVRDVGVSGGSGWYAPILVVVCWCADILEFGMLLKLLYEGCECRPVNPWGKGKLSESALHSHDRVVFRHSIQKTRPCCQR